MADNDYRKKLTLETVNGQRGVLLYCRKGEKKSLVKRIFSDGREEWMSDRVTAKYADNTPKFLHIAIEEEGFYKIINQPSLNGLYCFYRSANRLIYYSSITTIEMPLVASAVEQGDTYVGILSRMGKRTF